MLHEVVHLVATASSVTCSGTGGIQSSCNSFFNGSGSLGSTIQGITSVLAFPFFLVAAFMVYKRIWKKRHGEALLMFALVCIATAIMLDLSILATLMSAGAAVGAAVVGWISSVL